MNSEERNQERILRERQLYQQKELVKETQRQNDLLRDIARANEDANRSQDNSTGDFTPGPVLLSIFGIGVLAGVIALIVNIIKRTTLNPMEGIISGIVLFINILIFFFFVI